MWTHAHRSCRSVRAFHTSGGGCHTRFRGSRPGGRSSRGSFGNSPMLLEKYVKHFAPNGSLIVRSPFNVKVRGSYFDMKNNVDQLKNKRVQDEILNESMTESEVEEEKEEKGGKSTSKEGKEHDHDESLSSSLHGSIIEKLSQTLESILPPSSSTLLPKTTPLHLLIYGRLHHRVDSYSIVDASQKHITHLYLTDANSFDEAESMLTQQISTLDTSSSIVPDALFTLLTPNILNPSDFEGKKLKDILESSKVIGENETLSSTFKLYTAKHILDINNSGIKTVFLIPTVMSKIYLQGEGASSLELDSSLIHKVDSVGLHTEFGNISVRDLVCDEIRLASQLGDILCEGNLYGHIVVEINHDGDFLASYVDGPSLLVTTDDGDISILGGVNSDVSQFYTRNGRIYVKQLSNQSYMLVRDTGSISASVEEGFLTAVVKNGSIHLRIDSLSADSSLQVENGEISLKVMKDRNFRISCIAQHTNISPQIANQGEFSFNEETSHQTFQIDPSSKVPTHLPAPVLKVEVLQGTLNLSLVSEDQESSSESESRKNT